MDIKTLIDQAKQQKGSINAVAEEMGINPCRLSDWKAGRRKPEAGEVAVLADMARLQVLETVAEIETQLRPAYARVWRKAVSQGMAKSLFHHFFSSGPSTSRFSPHFGWCGSRA